MEPLPVLDETLGASRCRRFETGAQACGSSRPCLLGFSRDRRRLPLQFLPFRPLMLNQEVAVLDLALVPRRAEPRRPFVGHACDVGQPVVIALWRLGTPGLLAIIVLPA